MPAAHFEMPGVNFEMPAGGAHFEMHTRHFEIHVCAKHIYGPLSKRPRCLMYFLVCIWKCMPRISEMRTEHFFLEKCSK